MPHSSRALPAFPWEPTGAGMGNKSHLRATLQGKLAPPGFVSMLPALADRTPGGRVTQGQCLPPRGVELGFRASQAGSEVA